MIGLTEVNMNIRKLSNLSKEDKFRLGLHYSVLITDNTRELYAWIKSEQKEISEVRKITHKGYRLCKRMRKLMRCMSTEERKEFCEKEIDFILKKYSDHEFKEVMLNFLKSLSQNRILENLV